MTGNEQYVRRPWLVIETNAINSDEEYDNLLFLETGLMARL
jgi:hypothetical protein